MFPGPTLLSATGAIIEGALNRALTLDPASDEANMEAMRVFHAQGRPDTVARQYRQYRKAMEMIDAIPDGSKVQALFLALTGG